MTPGAGGCNPLAGCGDIQLTTAFSVSAAFEHLWTPSLKTSIYGSYVDVSHNAQGAFLICNSVGTNSMFTVGNPTVTGCNPDWSAWNVGSRTQWEPVKGFIMGVDVIYNKLNSAQANNTGVVAVALPVGGRPAGNYVVADQDAWTGTFRVQRDFLP